MVTVGQAYSAENREKNRVLYERLERFFSERWKVIFVGDNGVGKSNILFRFAYNYFDEERDGYCGHEYTDKWLEHEGKKIKIGFWDTGGRERFEALGNSYFRGVDGAFLVYDITNHVSFEHTGKWLEEIRNAYYARSDPIILLVGNKTDMDSKREVNTVEAKTFAEANGLLHIEVSALEATNIKEAFQILVGEILQGRFHCDKEEIKFREHHELLATFDSERSIQYTFKDIARLCLHPDVIMTVAFLGGINAAMYELYYVPYSLLVTAETYPLVKSIKYSDDMVNL